MIGSIYNVGFGNGYTNYNNSNYLVTNNLKKCDKSNQQQTLTGDSFENSQTVKPETKSNLKKYGLIAGGALALLTAAVLGHNALKTMKHNSLIKEIESKFDALSLDLPKVQDTFKKVFRRDDLTVEQTKELLTKYKGLELLRIDKNMSREDYAKAVMKVASEGYDLEHANINLVIKPLKDTKAGGYWDVLQNSVVIGDKSSKEYFFACIHHELRHAKQSQAVIENLDVNKKLEYIKNKAYNSLVEGGFAPKDKTLWEKEVWTPEFTKDIVDCIGGRLARKNVVKTPENIEYAERMFDAEKNHVDIDKDFAKYWTNPKEVDARAAETSMNKLFGLNDKTVSYYAKQDAKYLKKD